MIMSLYSIGCGWRHACMCGSGYVSKWKEGKGYASEMCILKYIWLWENLLDLASEECGYCCRMGSAAKTSQVLQVLRAAV